MQKGDKDLLKLAQVAEGIASSASDQLDPVILFISSARERKRSTDSDTTRPSVRYSRRGSLKRSSVSPAQRLETVQNLHWSVYRHKSIQSSCSVEPYCRRTIRIAMSKTVVPKVV